MISSVRCGQEFGQFHGESLASRVQRRWLLVFGPLDDEKELAGAIRKFAQAIADRYGRQSGRIIVSVSLKP